MSEPNATAAALSGVTAGSLAVLFPQYVWIIWGGLAGAIYALWSAEQMSRWSAVKFVGKAMLPALVFSCFFAGRVSSAFNIDVQQAFSAVAFLIAVFHREGAKIALEAIKTGLRVLLRLKPEDKS
jgi:hypothetical protein